MALAEAMDILSRDIQCEDGVANAAIAEAAQRLRELEWEVAGLTKQIRETARDEMKSEPAGLSGTAGPARRVVCAAMLMDDGLIVPGVRHFSPEMRAVLHRIYGDGYHLRVREHGFIDTHGNFLSRKDAWIRADQNGQILLYDPSGKGRVIPQPANEGTHETLFSENLY